MLRNSFKNGNILADNAAQLELLPFSCVNMAEEVPHGLCFEDEIEDLQGTHVFIKDAVWRIVSDKDVKIVRYIFVGYHCIPGNGADDYTIAILYGILQNSNAGSLELVDDVIGLV